MTKDLEKLSAWYDDEISQEDFDKGLESLGSSSESKKILHQYAILSELMQRKSKPQISKLAQLIDYLPQKNPWLSNVFTAAATVLMTIVVLYQVDADRFGSDKASQLQLTSALSSQEAKDSLIKAFLTIARERFNTYTGSTASTNTGTPEAHSKSAGAQGALSKTLGADRCLHPSDLAQK